MFTKRLGLAGPAGIGHVEGVQLAAGQIAAAVWHQPVDVARAGLRDAIQIALAVEAEPLMGASSDRRARHAGSGSASDEISSAVSKVPQGVQTIPSSRSQSLRWATTLVAPVSRSVMVTAPLLRTRSVMRTAEPNAQGSVPR